MKFSTHDRAEVLAGAITLGEATNDERLEYRRHLAECAKCLTAFGGEHELERLQTVVRDAAASEVWEPDVRGPIMDRVNDAPRKIARYGLGILGVFLVIALIGKLVVGSSFAYPWSDPPVLVFAPYKVTLERQSTRDAKTPAPAPARMVVEQKIVQVPAGPPGKLAVRTSKLVKPAIAHQQLAMELPKPSQMADTGVQSADSGATNANVPAWRSALPTHKQAYVNNSSSLGSARAESLTIAPVYSTREAEPEGGDTAIAPRPPAIAAEEGAEGTTAFEVSIDESGNPTKCTIAMSSGYPVLDDATCKAAMKIHYHPKTLNGKPVPGMFRDAFTFRGPNADTVRLRQF